MKLWMRWLVFLSLSLALLSAACQSQTEKNQETKEEQKKESETPKRKGKSDQIILTVKLPGIPQTLDEFKQLRAALATTPEGGAATFIAGLLALHAKNPQAPQMIALTFMPSHLQNGELGPQMKERIIRGLGERPNVAPSYIAGTKTDDRYKLPSPPFTIEMHLDPTDAGSGTAKKLFIWSSGAESARGIELRLLDGFWQVENAANLLTDVARPK